MSDLDALLTRLRAAAGADRWLDVEIARAVGADLGHAAGMHDALLAQPFSPVRRYTSSVDAALTLVPEGKAWTVGQNVHHWYWSASVNALDEDGAPKSIGWGGPSNSPALALCAAALQARMEALGE